MMHFSLKKLMVESPAHIPKGLSDPVRGRSVYLDSWHCLSTRCIEQVCGFSEKALSQPQRCVCAAARGHSAATQSQDSSPAVCWMKGSLCSPVPPDSPPFLCARPVPSFCSPSPKTEGGSPRGALLLRTVSPIRTSSLFNLGAFS